MKVIMVVHNQLEQLKVGLDIFKKFAGMSDDSFIIVDNASDDGLREWLAEQPWNFLVCDNGVESYAVILNTAIKEFVEGEDCLVIDPSYVLLPGAIEEMQSFLHSAPDIGAVSPDIFVEEAGTEYSYAKALTFAKQVQYERRNEEILQLNPRCMMLRGAFIETVGTFDEDFYEPINVICDYGVRGLSKGLRMYKCNNAYFYFMGKKSSKDEYSNNKERVKLECEVLKRKWNMNYLNCIPNMALIQRISQEPNAELNVLEVGCGCGANLLGVKKFFPNAQLYGVEINEQAAHIANCIANVQVANIEEGDIDFGDVQFDYIIFGDVLEHLREPALTLRYCRKWLKKDGRIIASIPNLMHYSVFRELLNGNFTYQDMGLLDRTHIHFFTYNEIIRLFEGEGYAIQQLDYIGENSKMARDADIELVKKLVDISEQTEEFMFWAYQYLVVAQL